MVVLTMVNNGNTKCRNSEETNNRNNNQLINITTDTKFLEQNKK